MMSCSILATAAGENPYKTANECLADLIKADAGENIRQEQTAIMSRGDALESVLLETACRELGIGTFDVDIVDPVKHADIPLQGSLDGNCHVLRPDGITIKEDPDKGIYVMTENKEIWLNGEGVLECKLTSAYPEDVPPLWRGPMQLQGLMDIKQASYGILVVCYQSIYWRYFIYPRDEAMVERIHNLVIDMDRRIKEKDYFPPVSSKDAAMLHPEPEEDIVDLPEESLDYIDLYKQADIAIKQWTEVKKDAELKLMDQLSNAKKGSITRGEHEKTTYIVNWGSRTYKPQPERVVPAKEGYTARNKTISIKEVQHEDN